MASIHHEVSVEVDADKAWAALRPVGEAHRLFAPVLVDGHLAGDVRTVRFANGMIVRERILDVDDDRRRVAYSVMDRPGMTFHHASMQVVDAGPGRCQFIWITDFLPPDAGGTLRPLIEQGASALKNNLESRQCPSVPDVNVVMRCSVSNAVLSRPARSSRRRPGRGFPL